VRDGQSSPNMVQKQSWGDQTQEHDSGDVRVKKKTIRAGAKSASSEERGVMEHANSLQKTGRGSLSAGVPSTRENKQTSGRKE